MTPEDNRGQNEIAYPESLHGTDCTPRSACPVPGHQAGKVVGQNGDQEPVAGSYPEPATITERYNKLNLLLSVTRHDVFNQLTALQCYIGILHNSTLHDPAQRELFNKLFLTADSISAIMRFTRDYQEIGTECPVWQEPGMLVDMGSMSLSPSTMTVINRLPKVQIHADRLIYRVFYTIIENAIRHGGKITRLVFTAGMDGPNLVISCEDDGIGIPTEEKERIFKKGYGKHTGLGLFFVREILAITGMMIRETGEPGKGARFEIRVPGDKVRMMQDANKAFPRHAAVISHTGVI
ncbi:MAG: HAMP domain-containing sensor histidine kinase [Methanoregula sp.]|nr:MAG: HAMP domain-containing sensor histidine kinase [Methanoregula sp.]